MIACGHCGKPHRHTATVKACSQGLTFTCDWLVDTHRYTEDGEKIIIECGATAVADERGFLCESGHSHINIQTLAAEGAAYASDEQEAAVLTGHGVQAYLPDDHIYIS